MNDPDFSTFTTWGRGNLFEDFEDQQVFEHHWGRTLTAADSLLFATTALRYCPLYLNAEYSKQQGHRDLVVDPLLVLATVIGMSVEDLSEIGGPFLGVNNVIFTQPVYPGDSLTCTSKVLNRRHSDSRPTTGIVTWQTQGFNQHQELVVEYQRSNLVAKRRPA